MSQVRCILVSQRSWPSIAKTKQRKEIEATHIFGMHARRSNISNAASREKRNAKYVGNEGKKKQNCTARTTHVCVSYVIGRRSLCGLLLRSCVCVCVCARKPLIHMWSYRMRRDESNHHMLWQNHIDNVKMCLFIWIKRKKLGSRFAHKNSDDLVFDLF